MKAFVVRSLAVLLFVLAVASGRAFVVRGPLMDYQTERHGYGAASFDPSGGPQDLHDEYRWNVPVITYGCDPSFVQYFGTNGLAEIDKAFALLNDLPPVSQITDQVLSNMYPLVSYAGNTEAATLGADDIKSYALGWALQNMGLISAEGFVWGIRHRYTSGSDPGQTNWIMRSWNYDPFTKLPTNAVNGVAYTYQVYDDGLLAWSYVDPVPFTRTTASSMPNLLASGEFVFELTIDDVGGLRHLYDTNNANIETLPADVFAGASTSSSSSPWNTPVFTVTNILVTNVFFFTPEVDVARRVGRDKISFVRLDYDYLTGGALLGWTNQFVDRYITNGVVRSQNVARAFFGRPDMVFSSADLGIAADSVVVFSREGPVYTDNSALQSNQSVRNGPGIIVDGGVYAFSNLLPYYLNDNGGGPAGGLGPDGATSSTIWASFDETSTPYLYPIGHGWTPSLIEQLIREASGGR